MKKLLILMLAAAMSFAAAVPVFADEDEVSETADAVVSTEGAAADAVDAVDDTMNIAEAKIASALLAGKVSDWFMEEFSDTYIDFDIVKDDYTLPATHLDFAELIYSYLASKQLISAADSETPFDDVNSEAVTALNAAGIINGVSDTEFAPESALTREAAATILARAYYYANPGVITVDIAPDYSDADEISDWALESVTQLYALNMMTGTGGAFMPKSELTLEQALAVILRANLDAADTIIDVDADILTDGTEDDIVEAVNPIVEYASAADLNEALADFAVADISGAGNYTAAYYAIDGVTAQIVYTNEDAELTIRKAILTDSAVTDISGVYGAEAVGTFEVTDVAKITGEETIEVSLSVYGDMQIAVWALDDGDAIYNFSLVIDSADDFDEEAVKALVIDIINTTPRN